MSSALRVCPWGCSFSGIGEDREMFLLKNNASTSKRTVGFLLWLF